MVSLFYAYERRTMRAVTTLEILLSLQIITCFTIVLSLFGAFRSFYRLLRGCFPNVSLKPIARIFKREKSTNDDDKI